MNKNSVTIFKVKRQNLKAFIIMQVNGNIKVDAIWTYKREWIYCLLRTPLSGLLV